MVKEFFGCYLLVSRSEMPRFKGRTYIGFTVDPTRRLKQHNAGVKSGGARKTDNRGPWDMILVVHGFPNEISALRFEWAWQNPLDSRRLQKIVGRKLGREKQPMYRLRVVNEMLNTGPWNRLALTVRWLNEKFAEEFPLKLDPPDHVDVVYGPFHPALFNTITCNDLNWKIDQNVHICCLCNMDQDNQGPQVTCLKLECESRFHLICLAKRFLNWEAGHGQSNIQLLPLKGHCPKCFISLMWSDVVDQLKPVKVMNSQLEY